MPEVCYEPKRFPAQQMAMIEVAKTICEGYEGYALTLRQLYYQCVARDLFPASRLFVRVGDKWVPSEGGTPNADPNYKWLAGIINDARLAGKFDWDFIIDRTRNLEQRATWRSPAQMIEDAAKAYLTDTWGPQKRRVEVWIEKDAAIGVIERICRMNNVPYFSCRGYTSQSEMWSAAARIGGYLRSGEKTVLLHIGDHDPSGLDMTDDITKRLNLFVNVDWTNEFMGGVRGYTRGQIRSSMREVMRDKGCNITEEDLPFEVRRIALTIDQINQYNPPPNPAKKSDSRFKKYQERTGLDESWELDALEPAVVEQLIQDEVDDLRVDEAFDAAELAQENDRAVLKAVSDNWETIRTVHAPKIGGVMTKPRRPVMYREMPEVEAALVAGDFTIINDQYLTVADMEFHKDEGEWHWSDDEEQS